MFNDNMIEKSNKILQPNIQQKNLQTATFAAGYFWGVEEAFSQQKGVKSTMIGYTGGSFENPIYTDVCTDKTGHAEAVQPITNQYSPATQEEDIMSVCLFSSYIPNK